MPAAARQASQLKKFRSAISSQSSSRAGYRPRARDCSPLPFPPPAAPTAASTGACEAHSLTVTTRAFGYAASPPAS